MAYADDIMSAVEILPLDARGVCQVTLNRADRANSMSPELVEALLACLERAAEDGTRLFVIRAAGANFCGGFDLAQYETESDASLAMRFVRIEQALQCVATAPFVSVACVHGAAFGAGADLVAACDHRLGSASSRFRFPGYRFGVALGTRRLAAIVGATTAQEMLVSGRVVASDEAAACGLLTHVLDDGEAEAAIDRLADGLAALDAASAETLVTNARRFGGDADRDMAMLVRSVARPGLRDRLRRYVDLIRQERERDKGLSR